ncbi:hypothetical protein EAH76_03525 [Sphingomonas glacialis]|uniref:Uncharacterized protein n=1 Tax=Sphingomonas glacialis TaxID=658225 RepID=A0A502G4W8_9SPHN|nr:hypothetical protein EAH76_03525 [Sphingomonas glacialis]
MGSRGRSLLAGGAEGNAHPAQPPARRPRGAGRGGVTLARQGTAPRHPRESGGPASSAGAGKERDSRFRGDDGVGASVPMQLDDRQNAPNRAIGQARSGAFEG